MLPPTLRKVDVPEGRSGRFSIERFEVSEASARAYNAENFRRNAEDRNVEPGAYTRLLRNPAIAKLQGERHVVVMSDTPAELRDHIEPVKLAEGRCLVHGLGLGIVVQAMLDKPEVSHVTVVEQSPDVIKLSAGHYLSNLRYKGRLEIIMDDALSWKPHRGARWDVVWHDIWDSIGAQNWESMKRLHRRFGRRAGWQGSWCRDRVFRQIEQERRRTPYGAELSSLIVDIVSHMWRP